MASKSSFLLKAILTIFIMYVETTASSDNHLKCNRWQKSCENYVNNCNQRPAENATTNTTDTPATTEPNTTSRTVTESGDTNTRQQYNWYQSQVWHSCCSVTAAANSATTGTATIPSGVYNINGLFGTFTQSQAYCDVDGGWTVIQKRLLNSTLSFNRTMDEYLDGFGTLESDFWYGLFKIRTLTAKARYELKITFTTTDGEVKTSTYDDFKVTGDEYTLSLGKHVTSENDDHMSQFIDKPFVSFGSTGMGKTCAETNLPNLLGGWWYTIGCLGDKGANLNGVFINNSAEQVAARLNINSSEMKIRPADCISRNLGNEAPVISVH